VFQLLKVVSLFCFLFVSLRCEHSKCVIGKIRSYVLLVSGCQACRPMSFMNGFMLKCVLMTRYQQWRRSSDLNDMYINFQEKGQMQNVFHSTGGQVEYRHSNGEISTVRIIRAGMGTRILGIANHHRNFRMFYYGHFCLDTEK